MGIKQSEREADCSPPPNSAEVKNEWSCTSTALHAFMVWRRNLHLYFYFNIHEL